MDDYEESTWLETSELLTFEQAQRRTEDARLRAVTDVLDGRVAEPRALAVDVIAAYRAAEVVRPSHCPDVDPKFGQCARFFGHDGDHYTTEYGDTRRPDGSHPWDY